jgi:hypothetical protein
MAKKLEVWLNQDPDVFCADSRSLSVAAAVPGVARHSHTFIASGVACVVVLSGQPHGRAPEGARPNATRSSHHQLTRTPIS